STCLLSRWPQVRVLPGSPFIIKDLENDRSVPGNHLLGGGNKRGNRTKMGKPTFDFWFTSQKVIPPVSGKLGFAAKAHVVRTARGRGVPVGHDFGECLGATETEAESKMRAKVQAWIQEQEDAAEKDNGERAIERKSPAG